MSQKTIVTVFRTSLSATGAPSGAAHSRQNFARSGFSVPQRSQMTIVRVYDGGAARGHGGAVNIKLRADEPSARATERPRPRGGAPGVRAVGADAPAPAPGGGAARRGRVRARGVPALLGRVVEERPGACRGGRRARG